MNEKFSRRLLITLNLAARFQTSCQALKNFSRSLVLCDISSDQHVKFFALNLNSI